MTRNDLIDLIDSDDELDDDELEAGFRLVYGRDPDHIDRQVGLYSLICSGIDREVA